jgi:hypothetical protein
MWENYFRIVGKSNKKLVKHIWEEVGEIFKDPRNEE